MANHSLNTYFIKRGFTKVEAITTESVYYKYPDYNLDIRVSDHIKNDHRGDGKLDIILPSNGFMIKGKTPKHNKPLYTVFYWGMMQIVDYAGLTAFLDSFMFMRKVQTFDARRMKALTEYNKQTQAPAPQIKQEIKQCRSIKKQLADLKEPVSCKLIDPLKVYTHEQIIPLITNVLTAKQSASLTGIAFNEFKQKAAISGEDAGCRFGNFIDAHNWVGMLEAMTTGELNVFINTNAVKSMFRQMETVKHL